MGGKFGVANDDCAHPRFTMICTTSDSFFIHLITTCRALLASTYSANPLHRKAVLQSCSSLCTSDRSAHSENVI